MLLVPVAGVVPGTLRGLRSTRASQTIQSRFSQSGAKGSRNGLVHPKLAKTRWVSVPATKQDGTGTAHVLHDFKQSAGIQRSANNAVAVKVASSIENDAIFSDSITESFAPTTYKFDADGSAVAIDINGKVVGKFGKFGLFGTSKESSASDRPSEAVDVATESSDEDLLDKKGPASFVQSVASNVTSFVVNGASKKPKATTRCVTNQAQVWIDAWSAGAPKEKLNAIKAGRDMTMSGENETEKNEIEKKSEIEINPKAPPNFDLGDMDLAEVTPGGAKRLDPNSDRDYPDSVFVSDDEADQEAMEDILGAPKKTENKMPSFSDITNMGGIDKSTTKCAFFDLDGTVCASNVVFQYVAWKMSTLSIFEKIFWVPMYAMKCAFYFLVDKISRTTFNNLFAMDFKGSSASEEAKKQMADISYNTYLKDKVFSASVETIANLKARGYNVVLVTGSVDFMIVPVAELIDADFVIANELETEVDGVTGEEKFSGKLQGTAVADDEKRVRILQYAKENNVDLQASRAYGDATADLAMLQTVGNPSVVSPKKSMRNKAKEEGWPVLEWAV